MGDNIQKGVLIKNHKAIPFCGETLGLIMKLPIKSFHAHNQRMAYHA
ncbi:MAG: hypothetical protein K4571_16190 [Deltaproteobacteria bacterium]